MSATLQVGIIVGYLLVALAVGLAAYDYDYNTERPNWRKIVSNKGYRTVINSI